MGIEGAGRDDSISLVVGNSQPRYARMSDSNRLLFAAAAIGLVICSIIWGVIGVGSLFRNPERAAVYYDMQDRREGNQYQTSRSAAQLTEQACTEASRAGSDDVIETNQRDLCAQFIAAAAARETADYAKAQTWIGLVGFAFVIVGLALNWIATAAATEQASLARRAIPQPYLQAVAKDFNLAKEGERKGLLRAFNASDSAKLILHNHGEAPAVLVHVQARLDLVEQDEEFPGFVRNDPPEPNMLVHGVVVGAHTDSDGFWANRPRPDSVHYDGLEDWWLHGYAVYSDGKGRHYALGFCFGFAGFGWVRATPPGQRNGDANYHREITKPSRWM